MKLVRSFIILAAVLLLGMATYWLIYKPDRLEELKRAQEKFLVQFDPSNITGFTIGRPDSSIEIEQGFGTLWNIVEPIQSEAENDEIRILFNHLSNAEILFVIEEDSKNLDNYGLAEKSYYLAIQHPNGDSDTLYTGLNSPDGSMTYVKLSSDDRVLTIDREIADYLKKPLRSYQSRTILNVYSTDIAGIEIIRGDDDIVTLTTNGYTWNMTRPWQLPVDKQNVNSIVKTITESAKSHFITESTDSLSQYGLENPPIIIRVMLSKGMPDKLLLIGDTVGGPGNNSLYTYAKQFDQDVVFTMQNLNLSDFTMPPFWFVEKHPVTFDRSRVNRIVLETGGNTFTIIKSGQDYWNIVEPLDVNIEETLVSSIFGISRFATVRDVYAFEPTEQDITITGLDDPQVRIAFYQNDVILERMEYGNTYTDDDANTYFRASARPTIFITRADVSETVSRLVNTVFTN